MSKHQPQEKVFDPLGRGPAVGRLAPVNERNVEGHQVNGRRGEQHEDDPGAISQIDGSGTVDGQAGEALSALHVGEYGGVADQHGAGGEDEVRPRQQPVNAR